MNRRNFLQFSILSLSGSLLFSKEILATKKNWKQFDIFIPKSIQNKPVPKRFQFIANFKKMEESVLNGCSLYKFAPAGGRIKVSHKDFASINIDRVGKYTLELTWNIENLDPYPEYTFQKYPHWQICLEEI